MKVFQFNYRGAEVDHTRPTRTGSSRVRRIPATRVLRAGLRLTELSLSAQLENGLKKVPCSQLRVLHSALQVEAQFQPVKYFAGLL